MKYAFYKIVRTLDESKGFFSKSENFNGKVRKKSRIDRTILSTETEASEGTTRVFCRRGNGNGPTFYF